MRKLGTWTATRRASCRSARIVSTTPPERSPGATNTCSRPAKRAGVRRRQSISGRRSRRDRRPRRAEHAAGLRLAFREYEQGTFVQHTRR
jgi:hypothetical protein